VRGLVPARLAAVAVLAIAALAASPTGAAADPGDDKARVDAELAQVQSNLEAVTERARQAAGAYAEASAALPGAQRNLADVRGQVLAAEAAERREARAFAAASAAYAAAGADFDRAATLVEGAREHAGAFAAAAYEGSGALTLNAILDAGSPTDLADRIGYVNQVATAQRQALGELTAARLLAKERRNAAETARAQAERAHAAARRALDGKLAAQAAAERAAAEVARLADRAQQAMTVANQERATVLARYRQLKAESERIAAELRAATRARRVVTATVVRSGAYFLMPTAGRKSSDFGMRYDPYYRVWQLHPGMDIAAPMGQPIYAAAAGRVVHAGWTGGYGNYTCVSHGTYQGRNLATCYGHQSRIVVSVGQYVGRGQLIGYVGSTGASTGPHLHFEVRLDGEPVNPAGWLPALG
jgi:murein DD-endopeptidase MepM/ murein hydrolase activator NlpD